MATVVTVLLCNCALNAERMILITNQNGFQSYRETNFQQEMNERKGISSDWIFIGFRFYNGKRHRQWTRKNNWRRIDFHCILIQSKRFVVFENVKTETRNENKLTIESIELWNNQSTIASIDCEQRTRENVWVHWHFQSRFSFFACHLRWSNRETTRTEWKLFRWRGEKTKTQSTKKAWRKIQNYRHRINWLPRRENIHSLTEVTETKVIANVNGTFSFSLKWIKT